MASRHHNGFGLTRRQRRGLTRRVTAVLLLALALLTAVPVANAADVGAAGFPLPGFDSWFGRALDFGNTPKQASGSAAGKSHTASADDTRSGKGNGKARGKGVGELDPAVDPSVQHPVSGPSGQARRGFDAKTSVEDSAKRTKTSKTFKNADGTTTVQYFEGPVNYTAPDGSLKPIDDTLVPSAGGKPTTSQTTAPTAGATSKSDAVPPQARPLGDGAPRAATDQTAPATTTAPTSSGGRLLRAAGDSAVSIAATGSDPALMTVGDGTDSVSFALSGAQPVAATTSGNTATFSSITPDVDLQLLANNTGIKQTLILHSASAQTTFDFPYIVTGGLTPKTTDVGVEFLDATGKSGMFIPNAIAIDSAKISGYGQGAQSNKIAYSLVTEADGTPALRLTLDSTWLHDASRVFPVAVDPSTSIGPMQANSTATMDTSNSPMGTYSGDLKIGTYDNIHAGASFVQFSGINGAGGVPKGSHVLSAQVNLWNTYASSCTATPINLYQISDAWNISSINSYPGVHAYSNLLGSLNIAGPYTGCGAAQWAYIPLTADGLNTIQYWANGTLPNLGFMVLGETNDALGWKRFNSFAQGGYLIPSMNVTYAPNGLPYVSTQYPNNNDVLSTLTPELLATGGDSDVPGWPNAAVKYNFQIWDSSASAGALPLAASGLQDSGAWKVPSGLLSWNKNYVWTVQTDDGQNSSPNPVFNTFTVTAPQPPVLSHLSQNSSGHGFDPSAGNFTTSATDASVVGVGPQLQVVRDYNSRDPRVTGAFGAAWSSVFDARVTEPTSGSNVATAGGPITITYPDGSAAGYGRNSDGVTFTAPGGRYAQARSISGGYTLTDKNNTVFTFTQPLGTGVYGISAVTDPTGRAITFTWGSTPAGTQVTTMTSSATGRKLSLTWVAPASGAAAGHVSAVSTDPATAGQPTTALTWTYNYVGDQLSSVCSPVDQPSNCTRYSYTTGSPFGAQLMDSSPRSYWRLGEAAGSSTAASNVLINEQADQQTYTGVALGQAASPLTGSTAKAATFVGGTGSYASSATPNLSAATSTSSIGAWFKTSTPGGVIFYYGQNPISSGTSGINTPALYVGLDGKLHGCFATGACGATQVVSGATVTDGNWHYALLAGWGNQQYLYLDGVYQGLANGQIQAWNQPYIAIGAGVGGGGWPSLNAGVNGFNGQISDVAVWNKSVDYYTQAALYATGMRTTSLITKITEPSGNTEATVAYSPADGTVTSVVDGNGGNWTVGPASVAGSPQVYRSSTLAGAPSGYWRLQDSAGAVVAADEVAADGNNAGYANVTLGTTSSPFLDVNNSPVGVSASFNGTTSQVTTAKTVIDTSKSFSVSAWVNLTDTVQNYSAVQQLNTAGGYGFWLGFDRNQGWSLTTTNAANDGTYYLASSGLAAVKTGTWTHLVGTFDKASGKLSLYVNGKQAGAQPTWTSPFAASGPLNIGGGFKGNLAEVAVYPTALSPDKVGAMWAGYQKSSAIVPGQNIPVPAMKVTTTDPGGKIITGYYDPAMGNRPLAITDATGGTTSFGYDTAGFLNTVTDANGDTTTTGHDVRGNVVSKTTCQVQSANTCSTTYMTYWPDDITAQPSPDPRNDQPTSIRDARSSGPSDNTYLTSFTYDASGNQTSVTTAPVPGFPAGRTSTTAYTTSSTAATDAGTTPPGLTAKSTTVGGKVTTTTYTHTGDISVVTDAAGLITKYTYDNLGRIATKTQISDSFPSGLVTAYVYDGLNRVRKQTDPASLDRITGAHHTPTTTKVFDPDGNVSASKVEDTTGGDAARTTSSTYDSHGHVATSTDAAGAKTTFGYDAYGNKIKVIDPNGNETDTAYDADGRPTSTTLIGYVGDPATHGTAKDLVTSSTAYDPAGRTASVTDAMGNTTKYTYTDNGLTATVVKVDANGQNPFVDQSNTYDAAGNLISRVTGNGATITTYTVDAASRPTSQTLDPSGVNRTVSVTYNPDDVVTSAIQKDGGGWNRTITYGVDSAGRQTSQTVHQSSTSTGPTQAAGQSGSWPLADATTVSAADSSGGGNPGTLTTGVSWSTDHGGSAVFDGNSGLITAPAPVVDTSGSYTFSAWVKPADLNSDHIVMAASGNNNYSVVMGYNKGLNQWIIDTASSDGGSVSYSWAAAPATAVPVGSWTLLTGTYNAATHTEYIYTNGVYQGSGTNSTPWKASKPLTIGAISLGNQQFTGSMSGVRVYNRALTYDEINNLATGQPKDQSQAGLAGWWTLADGNIGTAGDTSGNNRAGTLSGGVSWSTDHNGSAVLDGATGGITMAGPVVDTSKSFAVSAWVKLANTTQMQTVLVQKGAVNSGFYLQFDPGINAWSFVSVNTDTMNPTGEYAAQSKAAPVANTWYHLVGVFDASSRTGKLYVNGTLQNTSPANPTPFKTTGPFVIGHGFYNGADENWVNGKIAGVQAYNRVLSAAEVSSLYAGNSILPADSVTTTSWAFDKRGLKTSATDANGNATTFVNDEAGHLVQTSAPTVAVESGGGTAVNAHPVTTVGYNTFGEKVETQDPNGNTVVTAMDADGRPVSTTLPSYTAPGTTTVINAVTTRTYDNNGNPLTTVDPLSNTTTYTYDQRNQVKTVTAPGGGVTTAVYDNNGELLSKTGPTGAVAQATWDYLGRKATSTVLERYPSAAAYTTTYVYAGIGGRLSQTTSPTGVTNGTTYDNAGEVTSATDGAGNVTRYAYDFQGNRAKTTLPDGTYSLASYDALSRPISNQNYDATGTRLTTASTVYDGQGNVVSTTDARGNTSAFSYDAAGMLTSQIQPVTASTSDSITTSFGHDAVGNVTRYTDGNGGKWVTTYNTWNLPESAVEPGTAAYSTPGTSTFTTAYDADGQQVSQSAPGGVNIAVGYDADGNVISQSGNGAEALTATRTFAYNSNGTLKSANTAAAGNQPATAESFTYNDSGLLLTAQGSGGASSFTWNGDGAMTSRTDAAGTSSYGYDAAGRVATANDAATGNTLTYSYNTLNQVNLIGYGTAKNTRTIGYDNLHRLASDTLKTSTGTVVAGITYGWDANSNLISKVTTGFATSAANTYTYDQANRLTSWNNGAATVAYGYDKNGNRTQAGAVTYTYDARNQLTGDGTTTYQYTARGTRSAGTAGVASSFDAYNQAVSAGAQTYTYDAFGRVIADSASGGPSRILAYSGIANLVASDGANIYSRSPGGTLTGVGVVGQAAGSGNLAWTDLHTDVVATFTANGTTLAGSATYDPLGKQLGGNTLPGSIGYQSEFTEKSTGQVNMAARWYDPASGQFTSRDTAANNPVPNSVNANPFAYGNANPLTATDPTGHNANTGASFCRANDGNWINGACSYTSNNVAAAVSAAVKAAAQGVAKVSQAEGLIGAATDWDVSNCRSNNCFTTKYQKQNNPLYLQDLTVKFVGLTPYFAPAEARDEDSRLNPSVLQNTYNRWANDLPYQITQALIFRADTAQAAIDKQHFDAVQAASDAKGSADLAKGCSGQSDYAAHCQGSYDPRRVDLPAGNGWDLLAGIGRSLVGVADFLEAVGTFGTSTGDATKYYDKWMTHLGVDINTAGYGGGQGLGSIALLFAGGLGGETAVASDVAKGSVATMSDVEHVAAITSRLKELTTQAASEVDAGTATLLPRELKQMANPRTTQAGRGNAIDRIVKERAAADPYLSQVVYIARNYPPEPAPDFFNWDLKTWWDVTTPEQWQAHIEKYDDPFGDGVLLPTR